MGYYFIYSSFLKTNVKKITLNVFFIDDVKGIPHFKFAPLDYYGCSGVASLYQTFDLKLVCQKCLNVTFVT